MDWVGLSRVGSLPAPPCFPTATCSSSSTRSTRIVASHPNNDNINGSSASPIPIRIVRVSPPPPPPPRINASQPKKNEKVKKKPSVAEVRRAIGVVGDDPSRSSGSPTSSIVNLLSSSIPIGQAKGSAEKKLREAAEWAVDQTESRGAAGQQILMVVCLKILPVWLLLLLIASGVIKLPLGLPFDDLLS